MAPSFLPKQVLCNLNSHPLQRREKVGGSNPLGSYKRLEIVFLRLGPFYYPLPWDFLYKLNGQVSLFLFFICRLFCLHPVQQFPKCLGHQNQTSNRNQQEHSCTGPTMKFKHDFKSVTIFLLAMNCFSVTLGQNALFSSPLPSFRQRCLKPYVTEE